MVFVIESQLILGSFAPQLNFSLTGTNLQEPLFSIHQYSKIQLVLLPRHHCSPRSSKVWQGFLTMTLDLFFSISTSSLKFLSQLKSPRNCRHLKGASSYSSQVSGLSMSCLGRSKHNCRNVRLFSDPRATSYVATCARTLPLYTFSCR